MVPGALLDGSSRFAYNERPAGAGLDKPSAILIDCENKSSRDVEDCRITTLQWEQIQRVMVFARGVMAKALADAWVKEACLV